MSRLWVTLLCLAACGGSGPNAMEGEVRGVSLSANDAAFVQLEDNVVGIFMSDRSGVCTVLQANGLIKSATVLVLSLAKVSSQGQFLQDLEPGNYVVSAPDGDIGGALFQQFDGNCRTNIGVSPVAKSGGIHLAAIEIAPGGHATGTFDLSFPPESVSGTFDAVYCPINQNAGPGGCN